MKIILLYVDLYGDQKSTSDSGVSESDLQISTMRKPRPT
jgi:hypothetical protein